MIGHHLISELESAWRGRVQEARTQYERASDELKDEALEEYSRVLKVFTDLVIRGWLPRAPSR